MGTPCTTSRMKPGTRVEPERANEPDRGFLYQPNIEQIRTPNEPQVNTEAEGYVRFVCASIARSIAELRPQRKARRL